MTKKIILASGGIESTVATTKAFKDGDKLSTIHFDFGRDSAENEIHVVNSISNNLNIPTKIVEMRGIRNMFSGIMKPGDFLAELDVIDPLPDHFALSYLPGIIELAILYARQAKADVLVIGLTKEQMTNGKDKALKMLIEANNTFEPNFHKIKLEFPFEKMTKSEVVLLGNKLKINLSETWSCVSGTKEQCGTCNSCNSRKKAFQKAGIEDQTKYIN